MTYIYVKNSWSEVSGKPTSDMTKIFRIYGARYVDPLDQHEHTGK